MFLEWIYAGYTDFRIMTHYHTNLKINIKKLTIVFLLSGRGGATIRLLAEESGAKISMTSKDEAVFTQERILSISGPKFSCIQCLAMVLSKLAEDSELNQFLNKGTNYMTNINTYEYARGTASKRGGPGRGRGRGEGPTGRGGRSMSGGGGGSDDSQDSGAFDDISTSTTISMSVPELLIGNLLGKNVSTVNLLLFFLFLIFFSALFTPTFIKCLHTSSDMFNPLSYITAVACMISRCSFDKTHFT